MPLFCDDFDSGTLADHWPSISQGDGLAALESDVVYSGDGALGITGSANPTDCSYTRVERVFTGPFRYVRVRAMVWLDDAQATAYQLVA